MSPLNRIKAWREKRQAENKDRLFNKVDEPESFWHKQAEKMGHPVRKEIECRVSDEVLVKSLRDRSSNSQDASVVSYMLEKHPDVVIQKLRFVQSLKEKAGSVEVKVNEHEILAEIIEEGKSLMKKDKK